MTRFFGLFLVVLAALFAGELTPPVRIVLVISVLLWSAFNRPLVECALRLKARTAPASSE